MQAAFPRRTRPGWPLLATLGVHLLLAWSWRIAHPPAALDRREEHEEQVFELIPVPPPALLTPPIRPQTRPLPPPPRSTPPKAGSAPRASSDAAPAAPLREPEPITQPADAPARVADPFAVTTPAAPPESALDAMVGRAKRDAVVIDREMRKGKSGVPEVADTPMGRFRAALEGAHKDRSFSVTSETYTAPDGQVIYRFRRGGKLMCRTGGSVGPKIGGAVGGGEVLFDTQGGGGAAGSIRCPSHADWKRD